MTTKKMNLDELVTFINTQAKAAGVTVDKWLEMTKERQGKNKKAARMTLDEALAYLRNQPAYEEDGITWRRKEVDFEKVQDYLRFYVEQLGDDEGNGLQLAAIHGSEEYRLGIGKNHKTGKCVLSAGIYKIETNK